MKHLFTLLLLLAAVADTRAQCCSAGNPLGGSTNVGTLDARTLRALVFLRHSYSDTYYEGSHKAEYQGSTAGYSYIGSVLSYGITRKLTAEAELGVFLDKHKTGINSATSHTWGLANGVFSLKYGIWKDVLREWEVTAGAGVRFPFSQKLLMDEYQYPLSMDIQPSTGAYGFVGQLFLYKGYVGSGWRFFLLNRYEKNAKNDIRYQYGDAFTAAFFTSRKIDLRWTAILQLRSEWRAIDHWEGIDLNSTGGNLLTLSPQLNYTLASKWHLSCLVDIPIYRAYNLAQLSPKYAFAVNVVRDFAPRPRIGVK